MYKIKFKSEAKNEKEFVRYLQEKEVLSQNNFHAEMIDNAIRYNFSEWFKSMELLSDEARKKAYEMFSEYEKDRFSAEWYYDIDFYNNGEACLLLYTNSIAIDICDSGPYEFITVLTIEPYLKMRIDDMFKKLKNLGLNPVYVLPKEAIREVLKY